MSELEKVKDFKPPNLEQSKPNKKPFWMRELPTEIEIAAGTKTQIEIPYAWDWDSRGYYFKFFCTDGV